MKVQPDELIIAGDRVGFGPLRSDLVETYQRWINDLRVNRTLGMLAWPMTLEAEQGWLDHALRDRSTAAFTVYELSTGMPIGNASLTAIDWVHDTATYGIMIGEPDAWNKGYGTETTRLMLNYAFDVLGLVNVMLEVYAHNPGDIRAYERAGFKRIGVRRGARRTGRSRKDIIIMDATPDDVPASALAELIEEGSPKRST